MMTPLAAKVWWLCTRARNQSSTVAEVSFRSCSVERLGFVETSQTRGTKPEFESPGRRGNY